MSLRRRITKIFKRNRNPQLLSIDNQQFDNESQHVHDANDSIHGRKSLEPVLEETVPIDSQNTDNYCQHGEEEHDLMSSRSPHFTTSSARPMNIDPNNPIVPGRNQKQFLTLSFQTHHDEDSGVGSSMYTSQTINASDLSTFQSPPESHTPYEEESLDQTQNLSGIRKRFVDFVPPTQDTHIRQSQSVLSDTAYLQSQPFIITGKRYVAPTQDMHIRQSQSGPSDTAYLQSQPFSSTDKREDNSQLHSIVQLLIAPQRVMELNNENEALSDDKDSELEMLKTKLKTKDESIKELIKEKDAIKKTSLNKDKDITYWKGALKSSQEKVQGLENKLSLTTVKKLESQRDAIIQFDYWVPMEDLLHGAHVVDERVFNVQGDKEQYFNWNECGFRLYIPAGALLPTETCPVAVKAIIAGRFILPKRTELVSAFYAISASRKLQKKVKTELQHCLLLENEAQTEHLHFIKAHQTNPGLPYHFELQPGGEFMVNTRYAALWQSEFSIEAIVKVQPYPDDESGSDNEGSGNDPENSTEEEGDQNQEEDQNTDEVTSKEGSDESHDGSDSDEHISSNNELLVNTSDSQECPKDVNQSIKSQQVVEPNTQLTIGLESKNTQTEQITDFDNGLYRAHTFYDKVSRHEWIFKFAAIKHLNVHIKYIEESDALKHLEKAESFEFRFKEDPQGYICLNVSNTESLPNGWHVDPYSLPCGVSKTSIDLLATQFQESPDSSVLHVYPVIPMCMVSIHADADTSLRLRYAVPVEGIVETKTIFLMRSIAIEVSRSPGATQQEQKKEEAKSNSIEQQGVQESKLQVTDFPDVISATSSVVDWLTLGIFLKVNYEQLKTIEKNYPGNLIRCRQEMLNNWIRSGNATWSILVNVLYNDVNEKAVAEEIAKKYLKKQL